MQTPAGTSQEAADIAELSRLETIWNEAHLRGDVEALERLWAEDLVITLPGLAPMEKRDVIRMSRSGRVKFQRYQTSDTRIRVYGDAAVVTGRVRRSRDFHGRAVEDDWRFTKVYIRNAGGWQIVAFHASIAAR